MERTPFGYGTVNHTFNDVWYERNTSSVVTWLAVDARTGIREYRKDETER